MKTDSLFYRLLQAQPTLAFELAGQPVPESSRYGFVSQELKQTAFRLDGIAEPPASRPDAPRAYVEVQFQKLPLSTREEIQKMFNFTDVSLKETRFYQDVFAEGVVEGRQAGRLEGEAAVLLRQLQRKFGTLPDPALRRIADADAETLLVWAERVLDAGSLDEVWGH